MKKNPKTRGVPKIRIHGNAAHNAGILIAIGGLVVNWSNNESVFLAMLQALVPGGKHQASIIWQSQKTSRPRLELVLRLARDQVTDKELIKDIGDAISQFFGLSRARNFYCHATYEHAKADGAIMSASGMSLTLEEEPLTFETKPFNLGTFNEIGDISMKLAEFNQHLWTLVRRLDAALGVQRSEYPEPPPQDRAEPDIHVSRHKDEGQ